MRTVVQGIIDSQRSRAFVQPAAGRAPLLLRVKGTLMCEHNDYRKELRLMNSARGTQAAESFDEYMQVVVGEIVALRDAVLMFFPPDPAESESNNNWVLQSLWHEGLGPLLEHLGVECVCRLPEVRKRRARTLTLVKKKNIVFIIYT